MQGDALEILHADHVALLAALEKLRSGKMRARSAARQLASVCNALVRHALIERELFYPALRGKPGFDELLDASRIEHRTMNELIGELVNGRSRDGLRAARIEALAMYAAHHFNEEDTQLFPRARAAGVDLAELGARIARRFTELDALDLPLCRVREAAWAA